MSDIVARLRAESAASHSCIPDVAEEAADEIERLRAEVARLDGQLKKRLARYNEDGTFSMVQCENCGTELGIHASADPLV